MPPLVCKFCDLKKAFDRIKFDSLFKALEEHHVPKCYCALLWNLYRDQHTYIYDGKLFDIEGGVRQGDVISPLLFNAGLEHALPKWKNENGQTMVFTLVVAKG